MMGPLNLKLFLSYLLEQGFEAKHNIHAVEIEHTSVKYLNLVEARWVLWKNRARIFLYNGMSFFLAISWT